jgi:two-component system OmpR family response regulator
MKVLVIEDDPSISAFLEKGLREAGFAVDVAANGIGGEQSVRNGGYDVVLLDLMLPQKSGLSVLRSLRDHGQHVPVICLTAKDTVHDRVAGLDAGADDYLVKPFSVAELLARIRAVLRRGLPVANSALRIRDLRIDPAARTVERGGRRIDLSPKEYAVLEYLARNEGHILTRTMILQHVWDCRYDPQTNVVDVHINRLRRKIDDGYSFPLISTVRGAGYVIREDSE